MSQLLYIKASPRAERSHSLAVADAFVDAYRQTHLQDEVATLDVFQRDLPSFDGAAVQAKYSVLHGKMLSTEEAKRWREVESVIAEFKGADKYVFAVPMWNFGIPYRLKQYIDLLVQPTYTFTYSPQEGYKGLVTGKPVFVAYARGGEYPVGSEGEAYDLQKRYLELILGFIGLSDIRSAVVEPTLAGEKTAAEKRSAALAQARRMATEF